MSGTPHYTATIQIHRVTHVNTTNTPTCRCMSTQTCNHAKPKTERDTERVINIEVRTNGVDDNALRDVIEKAIGHLRAEQPARDHNG